MKFTCSFLVLALSLLIACNKSSAPASSSNAGPMSAAANSSDSVQQKLREAAGSGATDCGRLDVHATADQLKAASDCAMQASQGKHAFSVEYTMPGMNVGVAGNADGKLSTAQSQGSDPSAVTAGNCPSQLRVASSGRVTCFAPGDMSSMSGSHAGGAMTPGAPNPHTAKPNKSQ
jgi:hypothetical protein